MQGGIPMVYFAGKRVDNSSVEDRHGTGVVEGGQQMTFFPYGEQRSGMATEVQFATYKRDSTTNLDYAHHRYYSSQIARFTTPDPKASSAKPQIPQSWNRYSYALGEPVNMTDPDGADPEFEDGEELMSSCAGDLSISPPSALLGTDPGNTSDPFGLEVDSDDNSDDPCEHSEGLFDSTFGLLGNPSTLGDPSCGSGAVQPPPSCSLTLEYKRAALTGRTHAMLVVTDSSGFTFTMQGEPHCYPYPQGFPPTWGDLDVSETAGDVGYQHWGATLTSATDANLCDSVAGIETAENAYANDQVAYNPLGPNSNSLVHWLLEMGDVDDFTATPKSTGWNTPLYGRS